ncbi:MAG: response regulator [Algicola sp.]|nr:response regulator [Algicola sp.]
MSKLHTYMMALLLLLAFLPFTVFAPFAQSTAQPTDLRFKNYSVDDGLSQIIAQTVYQDKLGFIWVGTEDGLNRFDGYQFKHYKHDPQNPQTLSANNIGRIIEDATGSMWVQTPAGLDRYHPKTDSFERLDRSHPEFLSVFNHNIRQLLTDSSGLIWAATTQGLIRFNPTNNALKKYQHQALDPNSLGDDWLWTLFEDNNNTLWIGSYGGGLIKYNRNTDDFSHYPLRDEELVGHAALNSQRANRITSIAQTSDDTLWLGTYGAGLFEFDKSSANFVQHPHQPKSPNSLRRSKIWDILIDNNDNFWVRSEAGLDRFDVHSKTFTPQLEDQWVQSFYQDKTGGLWALINDKAKLALEVSKVIINGTDYLSLGLDNIGHASGPLIDCEKGESVCKNATNAICLIQRGNISYREKVESCQKGGGLGAVIYNNLSGMSGGDLGPIKTTIPAVTISLKDGATLKSTTLGQVTTIGVGPIDYKVPFYPPSADFFWPKSIVLFDQQSQQFKFNLKDKTINQLFEDNQNNLWVATNTGLSLYNHKTQSFTVFEHDPAQRYTLPGNAINSTIQDQSGIIWLGTNGGLSKLNLSQQRFGFVKHNPKDSNSLTQGVVSSVYKENAHSIWIGTTNGLNHYNPQNGDFRRYQHQPNNPQSLSQNDVITVAKDYQGNLWVGTADGLNRFNVQSQTFTHYKTAPENPNSISNNIISTILPTNDGKLWIGTVNGLNAFDSKTQSFKRYGFKSGLSDYTITRLYQTQQGDLWIGTQFGGLNRFNPKTQTFEPFKHNPDNPSSISHNYIYSIHQDNTGQLWVGTAGGLNRFNPKDQTFTRYREKDGLPSDNIAAIMNDEQGNLWLGTFKGIVKFNPTTPTFKTYGPDDGAYCFDITTGAYFQAPDGQLFMGSDKGYCGFYPQNIKADQHAPNVVLTDFKLLNKSVQLKHSLNYFHNPLHNNDSKALTLTHQDHLFSFDFAALHFAAPQKNKYKYTLEGFDKSWITTDTTNRHATYTNIPAGQYTFIVKGSNQDGVWSEQGRSIKLIIEPAPWRTLWAYLIYIICVSAFIGFIVFQQYLRQQALILAKNNAEKANQAKSIFIANVSHEIRTPLNAVLGYTQMLNRDTTLAPKHKQKIEIIEKSGLHLLGLINDILDISKIEAQAMQLLNVDFELVELIDDLALMFDGRCVEKQLDWQWINRCNKTLKVHADEGKLRQILINLLGNAVKFTTHGSVTLTLDSPQANHYRFAVSDSGIGIATEQQRQIFNAFSQTVGGSKYGGTGLGLAIASKQVTLMGGKMQLDSEQDKGSRFYFTVVLPPAKDPIQTNTNKSIGSLKLAPGVSVSALVVDDIKENRDILSQILLDAGITINEAVNGKDALEQLHQAQSLPDLIFMDIRMPIMNGIKAMQAIKRDFKDRCPICIVITAQAMAQDVDRYLNEGFEHYIAKPFRFEAVYECLVQLLDVEFEQQLTPLEKLKQQQTQVEPPLDLGTLSIPPALRQSIIEAADIYEVSKLEDCLEELADLGVQGQQLAKILNQYVSDYDMPGLLSEMNKVEQSGD